MNSQAERELAVVKAAKKTGLTVDQIETLTSAMAETWQEIGSDWLQAVIGEGSAKSIPRAEVIEAVTDADRLRTRIEWRCWPKGENKKATLAIVDAYYKLDPKQRGCIDKIAFPYARYGW